MTIITIPRILQEKLTEEGADALVEILDKQTVPNEPCFLKSGGNLSHFACYMLNLLLFFY